MNTILSANQRWFRDGFLRILPEVSDPRRCTKGSRPLGTRLVLLYMFIECFHSRGQHVCKFIGTKESVYIRKEFNSHRTSLGHQHGGRFIVLGHQYGRRDVMWKHSIGEFIMYTMTLRFSQFSQMGKIDRTSANFAKSENSNRFHVAVRPFSNRSQMTSKCVKTKK